jgi:hypothetical protein
VESLDAAAVGVAPAGLRGDGLDSRDSAARGVAGCVASGSSISSDLAAAALAATRVPDWAATARPVSDPSRSLAAFSKAFIKRLI